MTISIDTARDILADNIWEHPDSYAGYSPDGDYLIYNRCRDSDCLANSNYERILDDLEKLNPSNWAGDWAPVHDFRASCWAHGWQEYIIVRQDAPESLIIEAAEIVAALSDYPVYDEAHYCETEYEEANATWLNCYDDLERIAYIKKYSPQFEFADFRDLIACARGKYFAGYASELLA